MYITELTQPQLLVIYPGRFQPFHRGHARVYDHLVSKFGRNNVFIASSNKVEQPKSPFSFSEKSYLMQLTGIPTDRIVECSQPYNIDQLLATGQITVYDPSNTVVIFAVSEKDMAEDPRFSSWTKKDGTPSFFQPLPKNIKETEGLNRHGYIMTVPTFKFEVLGTAMNSASEIRKLYTDSDATTRKTIIKELFGKYTAEAEHILNNKLAPHTLIAPPRPNKLAKPGKTVKIAETDTPRNTATMGDNNDVTGQTLNKEMKSLGLLGGKNPGVTKHRPITGGLGRGLKTALGEESAINRLTIHEIDHLSSLIDEIKAQLNAKELPSKYVDALKHRIEKLEAERAKLAFR